MDITIKLNSGLGDALGPNFNLTTNDGTVNPSSAILSQLLAGITATVNSGATTITVTSVGLCTNSLDLSIPPATTTTTTVSGSTPTTTTTSTLPVYYYNAYKYVCNTCTLYGDGTATVYSSTSLILGGYYTIGDGYTYRIRNAHTSGTVDLTSADGPYYTCASTPC